MMQNSENRFMAAMTNLTPRMLLFLMVLSMVFWGGSWVSAKVIANNAAPEVLVFWRFFFTFVSFFPVVLLSGEKLAVSSGTLKRLFLAALFLVAYNKFFFTGLRTGLAGSGGVLVTSLNPVITFGFSALLYRTKLSSRELLGLVLGFTGGLILLHIWRFDFQQMVQGGNIFFLFAAFLWSFLTFVSHDAQKKISFIVYSFYVYGLTSLLDLPLAIPYGVFSVLDAGIPFWLNVVYLSVFATTFATTMYFFASSRLGSHRASSFIFIVPTSALLLSWVLIGEIPEPATIIGGALTVFAVYLINWKVRNRKKTGTVG